MAKVEGPASGRLLEAEQEGVLGSGTQSAQVLITQRPYDVNKTTIFSTGVGGSHIGVVNTSVITLANTAGTAGIFASFRNNVINRIIVIKRIEVLFVCPTAPTAAQQLGCDLVYTWGSGGGYTGTVWGGSAGNFQKKRTKHTQSDALFEYTNAAGFMTAPADLQRSSPFASMRVWQMANAAAVPHRVGQLIWDARNPGCFPLVLEPAIGGAGSGNTGYRGIEFQNAIAQATGTQRWVVTVEWDGIAQADWERGQRGTS